EGRILTGGEPPMTTGAELHVEHDRVAGGGDVGEDAGLACLLGAALLDDRPEIRRQRELEWIRRVEQPAASPRLGGVGRRLPAGGVAQRGDWPMPAKDYAATRYSSLSEITGANAGRLRPVWSFSTGVLGGHEGQPLVVDNTMYVVTPYPNVLYAFDLTREGYPLKWKYRPAVDPNALGIACCDAVNRGAFYADGKIVYNLLDGHTVAVAAATGKELWKTKIADLSQGETTPVAPLVVKHRVIVGASG